MNIVHNNDAPAPALSATEAYTLHLFRKLNGAAQGKLIELLERLKDSDSGGRRQQKPSLHVVNGGMK